MEMSLATVRLGRKLELRERAGQAARELREQHRVVGVAAARLLDVRLVVEADAEHLGRVGHHRPELGLGGGEGVGGETPGARQDLGGRGPAELGQADQRDEQVALDFGDNRRTGLVIGGRVAHDGPLG
jgi:hypothetical protein